MRYRTLDVRLWGDVKFRSLSPIQPSGQALFLYLLTNPNTNSIPGLYRAGAAGMAEELGWSKEDFLVAFKEVLDQGLVMADFDARVIFIPNALRFNKPQSINVIKSWSVHWDELPECKLKADAYLIMKQYIDDMSEGFRLAFIMACGNANVKTTRKVSAKLRAIQEQDQNQNQEEEQENIISSLKEEVDSLTNTIQPIAQCPHEEIILKYHEILPMCRPVRAWNKTRRSYLRQRWSEESIRQNIEWWKSYFTYVKESKFLIGHVENKNGGAPFIVDLEWLIKPSNFTKIIEGKYHNEGCQL